MATEPQGCKLCGRADGFDFHIEDNVWRAVVPESANVLCLPCFDYLASAKGIDYSTAIRPEVYFAGQAAVFEMRIETRTKATGTVSLPS